MSLYQHMLVFYAVMAAIAFLITWFLSHDKKRIRFLSAFLVASQLIGGLMLDIFRSHGVPLRALFGPICGAILLVVGAWLVARRSF